MCLFAPLAKYKRILKSKHRLQSNSVAVGETTSSGNINLTMALYVIFPHVLESPKGDPKTSAPSWSQVWRQEGRLSPSWEPNLAPPFQNLKKNFTLLEPSLAPGGQIFTLLGAKLGSPILKLEKKISPSWAPRLAPPFFAIYRIPTLLGAKFGSTFLCYI